MKDRGVLFNTYNHGLYRMQCEWSITYSLLHKLFSQMLNSFLIGTTHTTRELFNSKGHSKCHVQQENEINSLVVFNDNCAILNNPYKSMLLQQDTD